jgi:hypothetical protein
MTIRHDIVYRHVVIELQTKYDYKKILKVINKLTNK